MELVCLKEKETTVLSTKCERLLSTLENSSRMRTWTMHTTSPDVPTSFHVHQSQSLKFKTSSEFDRKQRTLMYIYIYKYTCQQGLPHYASVIFHKSKMRPAWTTCSLFKLFFADRSAQKKTDLQIKSVQKDRSQCCLEYLYYTRTIKGVSWLDYHTLLRDGHPLIGWSRYICEELKVST